MSEVRAMEELERERDKAQYQADVFLEKLGECQERCINAERESLEQARLLGMSAQREAKLIAQLNAERTLADRLAVELESWAAIAGDYTPMDADKALAAWKEARSG